MSEWCSFGWPCGLGAAFEGLVGYTSGTLTWIRFWTAHVSKIPCPLLVLVMSSIVTQSPVSLQLFSYILCNAVNAPDGKMYLNHWLFLPLLILPQDVWNDHGYFRIACLFNWSSPFFGMCCFVLGKPGEYCSTDNFGRAIWCSVEVVPLLVALSNKRNKREKKKFIKFW